VCRSCCLIAPPNVLVRIAEEGAPEQRDAALRTLTSSVAMRAQRATVGNALRALNVGPAELAFLAPTERTEITVYDVHNGGDFDLPGDRIRGKGDPESDDHAVNEAYEGAERTYEFFRDTFGRDSVDGAGLEIVSSVHYGIEYDNAAWTGAQMIYGDGGGGMFLPGAMTRDLAVIAHEITHGVTDFTANLRYSKQPGALNESFSDVFGSLVKQHRLEQTADDADWLIGEGILAPELQGVALRSLKAPGTAHRFDDQPDSMDGFRDLPDDDDPRNDHGGVHINSGIPNRAFYLAATTIGGNAWEKPGQIWYATLAERLRANSQFHEAAEATVEVAGELFGEGDERQAVRSAWETVGVL
jgi:Zn-dependent metalloprotease